MPNNADFSIAESADLFGSVGLTSRNVRKDHMATLFMLRCFAGTATGKYRLTDWLNTFEIQHALIASGLLEANSLRGPSETDIPSTAISTTCSTG